MGFTRVDIGKKVFVLLLRPVTHVRLSPKTADKISAGRASCTDFTKIYAVSSQLEAAPP